MNGHPSNATHETTTADPEIVDMIDGVAPQQHVQNNDDNDSDLDFDADDEPIIIEHTSTCKLALTIIGAAAGNFLEWFDFAVFGLLAEELADNFFPSNNGTTRLLELFSVYAGSFLMRPLGGMLFGYLGDRFGRLFALRLSIFLMAFPTFLTGCLPTYNQIGIAATILLVLLRLLQVNFFCFFSFRFVVFILAPFFFCCVWIVFVGLFIYSFYFILHFVFVWVFLFVCLCFEIN